MRQNQVQNPVQPTWNPVVQRAASKEICGKMLTPKAWVLSSLWHFLAILKARGHMAETQQFVVAEDSKCVRKEKRQAFFCSLIFYSVCLP